MRGFLRGQPPNSKLTPQWWASQMPPAPTSLEPAPPTFKFPSSRAAPPH
jgi:hypothetical protein